MQKSKLNITLDRDLIEYLKLYAVEQRTTISDIVCQFILNLKRTRENDPTETILSDPNFKESLLKTISKIQSGKTNWLKYNEVF